MLGLKCCAGQWHCSYTLTLIFGDNTHSLCKLSPSATPHLIRYISIALLIPARVCHVNTTVVLALEDTISRSNKSKAIIVTQLAKSIPVQSLNGAAFGASALKIASSLCGIEGSCSHTSSDVCACVSMCYACARVCMCRC